MNFPGESSGFYGDQAEGIESDERRNAKSVMAQPHANPPSHYHSNIFLLLLLLLLLLLTSMSSDSSLYKTKIRGGC